VTKKDWKILVGDCREQLKTLEDESVHMIWTSPPYFGLRNYGNDAQIGMEPSPEEFVAALTEVMREARRVLRGDGTLWLNIGDSYSRGNRKTVKSHNGNVSGKNDESKYHFESASANLGGHSVIKPKDLIGIPWRAAFALQADGWYLRQEITWAKGISGQDDFQDEAWKAMRMAGISPEKARAALDNMNLHVGTCMPESVQDRCTTSSESLFLLTKSEKYFYDHVAIRETPATAIDGRGSWEERKEMGHVGSYADSENMAYSGNGVSMPSMSPVAGGRNRRNVWCIGTSSYRGAHFATAPESLVEPCVKAGTSEKGCCSQCGAPYVRQMDHPGNPEGILGKKGVPTPQTKGGGFETSEIDLENDDGTRLKKGHSASQNYKGTEKGWEPTCTCEDHKIVPCTVLDPFMGAATTALVSLKLGRDSVGVELNPEYAQIAEERLAEYTRETYDQWDDRYVPLESEEELPDEMGIGEFFMTSPKDN